MRAVTRSGRARVQALGSAALVSMFSLACVNASPSSTAFAPSPIIVPDAATIAVGGRQTFIVQNATVARFDVSADNESWSDCVSVDETLAQTNGIRLVGRHVCLGLVYVRASVGDGRSPVVAVLKVE